MRKFSFTLYAISVLPLFAALISASTPLLYIGILLALVGFLIQQFSLPRLYFATWMLLLTNYFFGVLAYQIEDGNIYPQLYFLIWFSAFFIGYIVVKSATRLRLDSDISRMAEKFLEKVAFVGALSWVLGGIIYSYAFLVNFDISGLRLHYVYGLGDVSVFSQIGSIITGACFILVSRLTYTYKFKESALTKFTLILFLLVPIFMAGRQIYLQFMIMLIAGIVLSAASDKHWHGEKKKGKSNLIYFLAAFAFVSIVIMSFMRFKGGESILYESRLSLFSKTSQVELSAGHKAIYEKLPEMVQDIYVEFTYYFGAPYGKYIEEFNLRDMAFFNFDILEKSPFIMNNLGKVQRMMGFESAGAIAVEPVSGSISNACWATVVTSNIRMFGYFGAIALQLFFGAICALSQLAVSANPKSFVAHNFFLANCVVIVYGLMDSIFNEIYFIFYYSISLYLFFSMVKFTRQSGVVSKRDGDKTWAILR